MPVRCGGGLSKKEITVFCFTRWLEESATGNKRVKNIKSKKFDICQAEKFKNLRSQKVCTKEQLQELKLTEDMAAFDLQMGATFFNYDFLIKFLIIFYPTTHSLRKSPLGSTM